MKTLLPKAKTLLLSLALASLPFVGVAGTTLWSGAGADMNWSTAGNWTAGTGSAPPATNDTVIFTNNATAPSSTASADNIINANTTVGSLIYTNSTTTFEHNTQINPGVTLTVNGPMYVQVNGQTTVDAMSGTGNLVVNTTGNFTIGGPVATTTMTLADGSNQVTCATVSMGESGGSNGRQAILNLGNGTNEFFASSAVNLGTGKGQAKMQFAGANGGVLIAWTNQTGRVPSMLMGSGTSGSGSANGQLLFTGHPANVIVSNVVMGVLDDTGSQTAIVAMDNGSFDATSITMGRTTGTESSGVTSSITLGGDPTNDVDLIVNAPTLGATGNGFFIIADGTLGTGSIKGTLTLNSNATAQIYCPIIKTNATAQNVGTINLSGGTLIMEAAADTIGTAAIPMDNVNLGPGLLQLSVGGSTPNVVASTLNIAAPTTINIGALPVIPNYPAEFHLIQYASLSGDPTTITLGTLPAGTPPFEGYITNNTAASSIDLVITSGFIPTGVTVWSGSVNTNWDLTTANWTLFGSPTTYANGDLVQFDDTATGSTTVNLATGVNPASMTISNNLKTYTFDGPGGIVGSAAVIKSGTNTAVLANTGINTFSGGITINSGTLQFGTGGTAGNLPATPQPIVDNGTLVLNSTNSVTVEGTVTGSGGVIQSGAGVVSLAVSNSYSGPTVVNSGSLMVDGYIAGGGTVSNAPGSTLGGIGTILTGQVNADGVVDPGDVGGIGTLTVSNLTLYAGAEPTFDLNNNNTTAGGQVNDLIAASGNLTASGNTITVAFQGVPQSGLSYPVITYAGTLTGSFNSTVSGTHYAASVDTVDFANEVVVTVTGASGANLKWDSTNSPLWDAGVTKNWLNPGTSTQDYFYAGDTVLLDDSVAGVATNITIPAGVTVYPLAITNNSAQDFTINGPGSIGGAASIVQNGAGILTINNSNSYTGGLTINAGTLKTGNSLALGSTTGQTVINTGATLDVNGQNLGSETVVVSGTGVGGNGAIINSGPAQTSALKNVTLAGDVTLGGSNRWDIRGGSATLQTQGTPVNITKVGTNQVSLVACTCNDGNLENVYIQQGIFALQTSTSQYGDPNGFIWVSNGGFLNVWALTAGLSKNVVLENGGNFWSQSGSSTIEGTIILTNDVEPGTGIFTNDPSTTLVIDSTITGPGNLLKAGTGTTTLGGANNYTGNTYVNVGTLSIASGGNIPSPLISVAAGATFDVSQVTPLTLNSGQTLAGAGTVNGDITTPAGAEIAPGSATAPGTLTLTGSATLGGTTVMKLNGSANDLLVAGNVITLGGTLTVTNLAPLSGNQTYTLFIATNGITGAFAATNLPALGTGQEWITTNLANGVLYLETTVNTNPTNITATVSGNQLVLSWPADHTGWTLEAQTNSLSTGLGTNWVPVANSASVNSITNTVDPKQGAVFYRLIYP